MDYYTTLGVPPEADHTAIRVAYKRLARQWHPDRNPGSRAAEEQTKLINEAYSVLRDPLRRRLHDLLLDQGADVRAAGKPGERLGRAFEHQPSVTRDTPGGFSWGPSRLRLFPWEVWIVRWLLISSTWLFRHFHLQLASPWFWLTLLAASAAAFWLLWPASLALLVIAILVAGLGQGALLVYLYLRIKWHH